MEVSHGGAHIFTLYDKKSRNLLQDSGILILTEDCWVFNQNKKEAIVISKLANVFFCSINNGMIMIVYFSRYLNLSQPDDKIQCTYVWIGEKNYDFLRRVGWKIRNALFIKHGEYC